MITVNLSVKGLVLFAAVLLALSIGGVLAVTQLSAHQDDTLGPSVIHACVQTSNGDDDDDKSGGAGHVRIVGPDDKCKRNEEAVHWNTAGTPGGLGPAGPAGPQGPQGPVVIQGPPGP